MGLSSLVGVSLANLDNVDMQSSRNQLVLGISLVLGMCMPYYMELRGNEPFVSERTFDTCVSSVLHFVSDALRLFFFFFFALQAWLR